ncbi:MAG: hypothetical protein J5859_06805, partial [Clostridia bacterium]|nr:hypothetical protein [Clostridia bacterium]
GFGWALLRFLRALLIILIVLVIVWLGLRELEKRDIINLDGLRSLRLGGVTEMLFPDPDSPANTQE